MILPLSGGNSYNKRRPLLSYESKKQRMNKTAWVYLPYGYTAEKQYNVLYLSHGGWSKAANEYAYNALRFFWN